MVKRKISLELTHHESSDYECKESIIRINLDGLNYWVRGREAEALFSIVRDITTNVVKDPKSESVYVPNTKVLDLN